MLLDIIQNPARLAIIVVFLVVMIAILVLLRRRKTERDPVLLPDLNQLIDYTAESKQQRQGPIAWFKEASLPMKLLPVFVLIALIFGIVVFVLSFTDLFTSQTTPTPTPRLPVITDMTAEVAGQAKILVQANTDLPQGAAVTASMLEEGRDFPWFNQETAAAEVANGRIRLTLEKRKDAPTPDRNKEYTVVLISTLQDGRVVRSEPAKLSVPRPLLAVFYQEIAAAPTAAPTAESAPTAPAATTPPTTAAAPTSQATIVATAAPPSDSKLTATVFNGGNIRKEPSLQGEVLGQLHAGEVVIIIERTSDDRWYHVDAPEADGWVSKTLLTIEPAVARQVPERGQAPQPAPTTPAATPAPTGLTAKVFNGGNVRAEPELQGKVLDQINAGETVQLLQKTANGNWYQITNIRGVTGWVSKTLLTIDPDVAQKVPIAK